MRLLGRTTKSATSRADVYGEVIEEKQLDEWERNGFLMKGTQRWSERDGSAGFLQIH